MTTTFLPSFTKRETPTLVSVLDELLNLRKKFKMLFDPFLSVTCIATVIFETVESELNLESLKLFGFKLEIKLIDVSPNRKNMRSPIAFGPPVMTVTPGR